MGQKVHPTGFRLGIKVGDRSVKDWQGHWFATGAEYATLLLEDIKVRQHIMTRMQDAGVSKVEIERSANMITVTIHAAKPGIVIGKSGVKVEELRRTLEENFRFLERFAQAWQALAAETDPALVRFVPPATGELMDISALTFRGVRTSK